MPVQNRLSARLSYLFEILRMRKSFLRLFSWIFPFGRILMSAFLSGRTYLHVLSGSCLAILGTRPSC